MFKQKIRRHYLKIVAVNYQDMYFVLIVFIYIANSFKQKFKKESYFLTQHKNYKIYL